MKSLRRSAIALLATLAFSLAAVPDEIRGDLGKLVPEAVRLLEAKEYVALIETLATPDDIKHINAEDGGIAKVAEEFGKEKAASLLAILKSLRDKKAKVSDDGNTATYDVSDFKDAPRTEFVFVKIEGRWFIKN